VTGDLVAGIEGVQVLLHNELGVEGSIIGFILLELELAASITASAEQLDKRKKKFGSMRREDIDQKSQTKCLANVAVPVSREVRILTVEDWQEPKEVAIQEAEVDDEYNDSDVRELHESDLGELALCFIVDGVPFLDEDYSFKDGTGEYVDYYDHQRCPDHHTLLNREIHSPSFAISLSVWLASFWICELGERDLENLQLQRLGLSHAETMHKSQSLFFWSNLIFPCHFNGRYVWADKIRVELFLEQISLLLHDDDTEHRRDDESNCDYPDNADSCSS